MHYLTSHEIPQSVFSNTHVVISPSSRKCGMLAARADVVSLADVPKLLQQKDDRKDDFRYPARPFLGCDKACDIPYDCALGTA